MHTLESLTFEQIAASDPETYGDMNSIPDIDTLQPVAGANGLEGIFYSPESAHQFLGEKWWPGLTSADKNRLVRWFADSALIEDGRIPKTDIKISEVEQYLKDSFGNIPELSDLSDQAVVHLDESTGNIELAYRFSRYSSDSMASKEQTMFTAIINMETHTIDAPVIQVSIDHRDKKFGYGLVKAMERFAAKIGIPYALEASNPGFWQKMSSKEGYALRPYEVHLDDGPETTLLALKDGISAFPRN